MSDFTITKHKLSGTPLGKLIDLNKTDAEISEICSVSRSAVSKWRTGTNGTNKVSQIKAQAYLDAYERYTPKDKLESIPDTDGKSTELYLLHLTKDEFTKVLKLLKFIGLEDRILSENDM